MITELKAMNIEELVAEGQRRVADGQKRLDELQKLAEEADAEKRRQVLEDAKALLPEALGDFTSFHSWHSPNYEFRGLWDAVVAVNAPGLAPVHVRLLAGENVATRILDRGNGYPIHVIRYEAENSDDGYYLRERQGEGFDDIYLALAKAAEVGETLRSAQVRADQLNEQWLEEQAPKDGIVLITREQLFTECKQLIDQGDEYEGVPAQTNYLGAIAYGLYIIANEMVRSNQQREA